MSELVGGTLYVVATPLGNLQDLSPRVEQCLRGADVLYAEDTRRTGQLLQHLGYPRPLDSLHSHNESQRVSAVLESLGAGKTVALVSDAGTPGVSDPGAEVVAAAHEAGYTVSPIVGPSALAAALSVSGFYEGSRDAWFVGFLPTKGKPRRAVLDRIAKYPGAVVLFEGPHRAVATLKDLAELDVERSCCACRELTKMHEEVRRSPVGNLVSWAEEGVRGELTLVLGPLELDEAPAPEDETVDDALRRCLKVGLSARDASAAVAAVLELPKRQVYARCQKL